MEGCGSRQIICSCSARISDARTLHHHREGVHFEMQCGMQLVTKFDMLVEQLRFRLLTCSFARLAWYEASQRLRASATRESGARLASAERRLSLPELASPSSKRSKGGIASSLLWLGWDHGQ
eukprot:scaffold484828_cov17-Prasinocladus_malaysianus.AAC.1